MNSEIQLKPCKRTDRERFELLKASVRAYGLESRLRECTLCDMALVVPDGLDLQSCQRCKLPFCQECVAQVGTHCPQCVRYPNSNGGFSPRSLLCLLVNAKPPKKERELLNPGARLEVAEFACSDTDSSEVD